MVVVKMRAPSFPDTQAGVPVTTNSQVRYWSLCTNEPISTGVARCTPDNLAPNSDGFVTFVISDPSQRPPDSVLSQWGASWIPWGALTPGEFVYDINQNVLTNADGVFYNNALFYRQTMANPTFTQSINNVSQLPLRQRRAAMGDYWPVTGYCTSAAFQALGAGCIGQ